MVTTVVGLKNCSSIYPRPLRSKRAVIYNDVAALRARVRRHPRFDLAITMLRDVRNRWQEGAREVTAYEVPDPIAGTGAYTVVGSPASIRAGAEYWTRVGRLREAIGPYTLWTDADLDEIVNPSRGLFARWRLEHTPTSPPAFQDRENAPGERARAMVDATVKTIATSLAWRAGGNSWTEADRRAAEESNVADTTVRDARSAWCARIARETDYSRRHTP